MLNRTIATRFAQALQQSGMTKYALAKETGLTDSYLKKWADGNVTNPGYITVMKLANALDVPPDWLMGLDIRGPLPKSKQELERTDILISAAIIEESVPEAAEVLVTWASLPPPRQRLIANIIKLAAWEEYLGESKIGARLPDDLEDKIRSQFRQRARARVLRGRKQGK